MAKPPVEAVLADELRQATRDIAALIDALRRDSPVLAAAYERSLTRYRELLAAHDRLAGAEPTEAERIAA